MIGAFDPARPQTSRYAYGAVFTEVAVDARLGLVRVRRMLSVYDAGRIINPKLADYLVPVNADIPNLRAIYLGGNDPETNPLGVKGLGEIVQIGVTAAVANAVFHATGRRVRQLPITAEALL